MRADVFLFSHGLAKSRSHAAALISGGVTAGGKRIIKPSQDIPDETPTDEVIIENPYKYVSRGGYKLEGALAAFSLDVKGLVAADLGASTGGFVDCLLQNGAKKVFAIDVGHGQLDKKLAEDPRVAAIEGVNARSVTREMLGEEADIVTCDLSFISQALVYPAVEGLLRDGGIFVSLIKPQFEAGRENVGKNGIVKSRKVHADVIKKLFIKAAENHLYPQKAAVSPIEGGDGNREYLALFVKNGTPADITEKQISTITGA